MLPAGNFFKVSMRLCPEVPEVLALIGLAPLAGPSSCRGSMCHLVRCLSLSCDHPILVTIRCASILLSTSFSAKRRASGPASSFPRAFDRWSIGSGACSASAQPDVSHGKLRSLFVLIQLAFSRYICLVSIRARNSSHCLRSLLPYCDSFSGL